MSAYLATKLAHLLCFVYWLGADVGVFYSSRYVCDPSLGIEARTVAARIMGWIDMIPRYSLVLILPLGLTLASQSGWLAMPGAVVQATWFGALLWLALVWSVTRFARTRFGDALKRVDYLVRLALIVVLVVTSLAGLAGRGPVSQPWLAAKLMVFALAIASGLAIRILAAPFGPAFAQVVSRGSTPELERTMRSAMARAKPVVIMIWLLLLTAAWLGLAKPALG